MAVKVKFTKHSIEDINNIADYISRESLHYSRVQTERFFEKVDLLENFPLAGRIVPELSDEWIRELIVGNYRFINRVVSENVIDVLTVHHSSMLLSHNPQFRDKP